MCPQTEAEGTGLAHLAGSRRQGPGSFWMRDSWESRKGRRQALCLWFYRRLSRESDVESPGHTVEYRTLRQAPVAPPPARASLKHAPAPSVWGWGGELLGSIIRITCLPFVQELEKLPICLLWISAVRLGEPPMVGASRASAEQLWGEGPLCTGPQGHRAHKVGLSRRVWGMRLPGLLL